MTTRGHGRRERHAHIDRDISAVDVFEHVIRGVCLSHAWQSLHEAKAFDVAVEQSSSEAETLVEQMSPHSHQHSEDTI